MALLPTYNFKMENLQERNGYVYLIFDKSKKGYYKIGLTYDIPQREKTLQAENPCIVLLSKKVFSSRELARQAERDLHAKYKSNRIRGEWFEFGTDEINEILEFFTSSDEVLCNKQGEIEELKSKVAELTETIDGYKTMISNDPKIDIEYCEKVIKAHKVLLRTSTGNEKEDAYFLDLIVAYTNLMKSLKEVDELKMAVKEKIFDTQDERKVVEDIILGYEAALQLTDKETESQQYADISNTLESHRQVLKRLN